MGACYSVEMQVSFATKENEEKAAEILNEFVHSERANFSLDHWKKIGGTLDTFDDLVKLIFAGHQNPDHYDLAVNLWSLTHSVYVRVVVLSQPKMRNPRLKNW